MNFDPLQSIKTLVRQLEENPNQISQSAYDTAWLGWLYPQCRDWIVTNQNEDGSWSSSPVEYFHDRIICTLSAVNALAATSISSQEITQMEKGIAYLEKTVPRLGEDVSDLCGFEVLLPTMIQIGKNLGINYDRITPLIQPYRKIANRKISLLSQETIYSSNMPINHLLEFVGFEALAQEKAIKLISKTTGICASPASTAFVKIATQNSKADEYLQYVCQNYQYRIPVVTPIDTFESMWSLYNISMAVNLADIKDIINSRINYLNSSLTSKGIGWYREGVPDADDTSCLLYLLSKLNMDIDLSILENFEQDHHFQCFPLERNISLDVHLHILYLLKNLPNLPRKEAMFDKVFLTLKTYLAKKSEDYIVDKWHISPYYSTSLAVLTFLDIDNSLAKRYIQWILKTQSRDGSWIFDQEVPETALEETAYALIALMIAYEKNCFDINWTNIKRGFDFLKHQYQAQTYFPPLWINKTLYCPYHIVNSAILAALAKYETMR